MSGVDHGFNFSRPRPPRPTSAVAAFMLLSLAATAAAAHHFESCGPVEPESLCEPAEVALAQARLRLKKKTKTASSSSSSSSEFHQASQSSLLGDVEVGAASAAAGRDSSSTNAQLPWRLSALASNLPPDSCEAPDLDLDQVFTPLSDRPFPRRMGSCALVGSSDNLLGGIHGEEIDSHDTVVRINRVPSPEYRDDMGERLDVLFKNLLPDYEGDRTAIQYVSKFASDTVDRYCYHSTKEGCPMKMIIFEDGEESIREEFGWDDPPRHMAFPYVRQTEIFDFLEHNLAVVEPGKIPSAGLKTFLTMSTLCQEMRLFGFGGWLTVDHHEEGSGNHNLTMEHDFYQRAVRGASLHDDFLMRDIESFPGTETQKPLIQSVRRRLECMGIAGRLHLVL